MRSKSEVEAGGVPQAILVIVVRRTNVLEPCHIVVQPDWPEAEILADLDIQAATEVHRECRLTGGEAGRDRLSRNDRLVGQAGEVPVYDGNGIYLGAASRVHSAKQRVEIRPKV